MKILNQLELADRVVDKFDEMASYKKTDAILDAFGVREAEFNSITTRKDYIIERLKDIDINILIQIAQEELDMDISDLLPTSAKPNTPPAKIKHDSSPANAFISHISEHKALAKDISDALGKYNIKGFVAHEDIEPTKEWQEEIGKFLNKMDFFISLHTKGFSQRSWCQQEIGFAVAKEVEIISIKFEEDPTGFIGKYQALIAPPSRDEVIQKILTALKNSPQTKELYSAKIADKVAKKLTEKHAIPAFSYEKRKAGYLNIKEPHQVGMNLGKRPDELV